MLNTYAAIKVFFIFCYLLHGLESAVLLKDKWNEHKLKYSLVFDSNEELTRQKIFEENLRYIEKRNAANLTYQLEMNHLGHLTSEEVFRGINVEAIKKSFKIKKDYYLKNKPHLDNNQIPAEVDWRMVGAVSPVKDQGPCGSCWAFSTTGAIESQYRLRYGSMKLFSEQQLVDCDRRGNDFGCNGGLPDSAFEYAKLTGLLSEEEYPYKAHDGTCLANNTNDKSSMYTKIKSHFVLEEDELQLTNAIYRYGPISVAIDASGNDFRFYKSGIYQNPFCGNTIHSINHAVLAVGYGYDSKYKQPYYIVKNSWSKGWGDAGYIKMIRNDNNNCGIASFATYPRF